MPHQHACTRSRVFMPARQERVRALEICACAEDVNTGVLGDPLSLKKNTHTQNQVRARGHDKLSLAGNARKWGRISVCAWG